MELITNCCRHTLTLLPLLPQLLRLLIGNVAIVVFFLALLLSLAIAFRPRRISSCLPVIVPLRPVHLCSPQPVYLCTPARAKPMAFHPGARDTPYRGWFIAPGWRSSLQTWCRQQGYRHTPVEAGGLAMEDRRW